MLLSSSLLKVQMAPSLERSNNRRLEYLAAIREDELALQARGLDDRGCEGGQIDV
jgi:hypothetical protein